MMELVKPTGRVHPTDKRMIEIEYSDGLTMYARPCYPFFQAQTLGEEILSRYRDSLLIWVSYENNDRSYPVWLGWIPLQNKFVDEFSYPNCYFLRTEKFILAIDDITKEFTLSFTNGSKISVSDTTTKLTQGQNSIELTGSLIKNSGIVELGSNATHPVAYGDKVVEIFQNFINAINTSLVPDTVVTGALVINSATWTAQSTLLLTQLSQILSTNTKTQ